MTGTIELAVGETNRVAAWALRGLGMAFGVADRASTLVGWAEAVEGGALAMLREVTPLLDGPRAPAWHEQVAPDYWTMDATGRSLLEVGPVAVDLLTLAARRGGVGRVDLFNVADPVFLSGVARIASRRGVGLVAVPVASDLGLCGLPVKLLHAFPGAAAGHFDDEVERPPDALGRALSAVDAQFTLAGPDGPGMTLLSYRPAEPLSPTLGQPSCFDAEAKYAHAQSHGMHVAADDLAHLYALEVRTWAPTSDRSRAQALA